MQTILDAIQAIQNETCRAIIIAMLEAHSVDEIFSRLKPLGPEMSREEFDRRIINCRRELWKYMRGKP